MASDSLYMYISTCKKIHKADQFKMLITVSIYMYM